MIEITGACNTAKIYTDIIEENAVQQIKTLCDQEFVKGCKIRIMPDVHAGAGCVIGFTADLREMIIPDIVGVDIGCGMLTAELGNVELDFDRLDNLIRTLVPSGRNIHEGRFIKYSELQDLQCYRSLVKTRRIERSLGTLGGGNHFIEVDKDDENNKYLVIHTGSRNLGKQVAEHYQKMAYSPFLLSIKNAKIYDLDINPVTTRKWTELESVKIYYDFFTEVKDEFENS